MLSLSFFTWISLVPSPFHSHTVYMVMFSKEKATCSHSLYEFCQWLYVALKAKTFHADLSPLLPSACALISHVLRSLRFKPCTPFFQFLRLTRLFVYTLSTSWDPVLPTQAPILYLAVCCLLFQFLVKLLSLQRGHPWHSKSVVGSQISHISFLRAKKSLSHLPNSALVAWKQP